MTSSDSSSFGTNTWTRSTGQAPVASANRNHFCRMKRRQIKETLLLHLVLRQQRQHLVGARHDLQGKALDRLVKGRREEQDLQRRRLPPHGVDRAHRVCRKARALRQIAARVRGVTVGMAVDRYTLSRAPRLRWLSVLVLVGCLCCQPTKDVTCCSVAKYMQIAADGTRVATHLEHLVGLVKDQDLQVARRQQPPVHPLVQPAMRADDDLVRDLLSPGGPAAGSPLSRDARQRCKASDVNKVVSRLQLAQKPRDT